ncbi:MAG: DUF1178 family protein [Pseudomonadota bacterium]
MVIYDLVCINDHSFEGWFESNQDFAKQQDRGLLTCPICETADVYKKLSAPKLRSNRELRSNKELNRKQGSDLVTKTGALNKKFTAQEQAQYAEFQSALKKVHDYVEKNFEDVGYGFAEQAISMHEGHMESKNIRGKVSKDQAKELQDKGVPAVPLLDKPADKNKLN